MSEKLIVSWDDYNNTVERLAVQIYDSGYKPTLLVGIMRGGAPMIDVLSRVFKLKCAYLAVESYSGKGVEDEQGEIVFSREMSSIAKNMGGNILLCDDLSDTGITLNKSVDWLKKYEPIKDKIENIKLVLHKFYPKVNFIVRESKTGKYNIIIRGVKSLTYDEILMEHTLVFLDDSKIVLNSFIDSISAFHPDLTRDNSIVKYIMNNGKVKPIY